MTHASCRWSGYEEKNENIFSALAFCFYHLSKFFFFNIYGQNNIAQYILFIFIPVCSLQDNVIKNIIVNNNKPL